MRRGRGGKVRGGGEEGGTWILDSCSGGSSRPCWVEVGSWKSVVLGCGYACGFIVGRERQA